MATASTVQGYEIVSYDVEWQVVRGFWGSRVLANKDNKQGPWTDHDRGRNNLRLFEEYIQRVYSSFRDDRGVLGEWAQNPKKGRGTPIQVRLNPSLVYGRWGDLPYTPEHKDRVGTQVSDLHYSHIEQDRQRVDIAEDLSPSQRQELLYRTVRVHNALGATKMNLRRTCPSLLPFTEKMMKWVDRLNHITSRVERIPPPSAEEWFKRQQRWIFICLSMHDPQGLEMELHDPITLKPLQLPYYLSTMVDPGYALAKVRSDMKQRMAIAKRRTKNLEDPTRRTHLKSFLHLLEEHVPALRTRPPNTLTDEDDDTLTGVMDWTSSEHEE